MPVVRFSDDPSNGRASIVLAMVLSGMQVRSL